jgi:predicted phosphodiesterase
MKKVLVIPDTHAPLQDKRAVDCVMNYALDYKPDTIVHLGDVGEYSSVSHWLQDKRGKLEGLRTADEIAAAVELLGRFRKQFPKAELIVTMGNHDDWLNIYTDVHPEMKKTVDIERDYRNAGWRVIEINKPFQIGKLLLFHGMFTNEHHAKSTVHAFSKSCLYGHTHTAQLHIESFYDGEKSAQSIGCLCNKNPDFLKNRPNRWIHGFATVDVDVANGDFFTDFIKIVRGRFSRNGKIYKG